jgi:hypothetical protein
VGPVVSHEPLAGVALVHGGHCHILARHFLDVRRQRRDLRPALFMGWRDQQRKQLAQGLHRHVDFGPLVPLVPIVPCSCVCYPPASIAACGCPRSPPSAGRTDGR